MKSVTRVFRILWTAWQQASSQQASLLAAGVAFYAFTSLFPALIAAISIYGIAASPETVARQADQLEKLLPADAASLVVGQIDSLVATPSASLGLGAAIAIVLALYSASGAVSNLVTSVNVMFGLRDDRSFLKRKALALGLTTGGILVATVAIGLVAVLPVVLNQVDVVPGLRAGAEAARWLILLGVIALSLGLLYRLAPNREPRGHLLSGGVVVATVMWLVVSVGFSLYVNAFGNYSKTYGALAGVVVLLLWLWIGLYAVLLGAAIQAAAENDDTPDRTPV